MSKKTPVSVVTVTRCTSSDTDSTHTTRSIQPGVVKRCTRKSFVSLGVTGPRVVTRPGVNFPSNCLLSPKTFRVLQPFPRFLLSRTSDDFSDSYYLNPFCFESPRYRRKKYKHF